MEPSAEAAAGKFLSPAREGDPTAREPLLNTIAGIAAGLRQTG